ncbi:MAG: portal protein, partial [bacterium]
ATSGVKIANDAITYVTSSLQDLNKKMVLSFLHKSIKALNQLRMIEDALVIYRLSRAPERRIFYIDVGNLPKVKAEQYLREVMARYRNKLVYDAQTGEIRDDKKHM